jgi:N-acyl-L-homoserine lactone synthetase
MIVFVHGYERDTRPELFDTMFRHRKAVFIDRLGWSIPPTDGDYEIDEFDREDTVYICSLLPSGELAGSVRLINTTTPHMAVGPFSAMFPDVTVRSPTIWEGTRFAVPDDRRLQPNGVSRAACEVLLGLCLFGLEYGVSQLTAIYEPPLARLFKKCWMTHFVLARHQSQAYGSIHFGLWEVSRQLEQSIRASTGISRLETVSIAA